MKRGRSSYDPSLVKKEEEDENDEEEKKRTIPKKVTLHPPPKAATPYTIYDPADFTAPEDHLVYEQELLDWEDALDGVDPEFMAAHETLSTYEDEKRKKRNTRRLEAVQDLEDFYGEDDDDNGGQYLLEKDTSFNPDWDFHDSFFRVLNQPPPSGAHHRPEIDQSIGTGKDDFYYQHTETTYSIDKETGRPEIRHWGVDDDGHSVLTRVKNFFPYFYFAVNDETTDVALIRKNLEIHLERTVPRRRGDVPIRNYILHLAKVEGRSICGYHKNAPLGTMYRIILARPSFVPIARKSLDYGNRAVVNKSYPTFEANVPFELRYMVDTGLYGCQWTKLHSGKYARVPEDECISTAQYEFVVDHLQNPVSAVEETVRNEKKLAPIAPMRFLSYDIEVFRREPGFPTADKNPVVNICCALNVTGQGIVDRVVFVLKPKLADGSWGKHNPIPGAIVYEYEDERHLLMAFMQYIQDADPDGLTGWNTSNFDMPYLAGRAKQLGILEHFMSFSRIRDGKAWLRERVFQSKAYGAKKDTELICEGRFDFDGLIFMLRGQMKKFRSYALNHISSVILKDTKLDVDYSQIPLLYESKDDDDRTRLAHYCLSEECQILTNKGFMFLHEYEKVHGAKDMTVCGYNSESKQYVYERPIDLVINDEMNQDMIEFTQSNESVRWKDNDDLYGRETSKTGNSNGVSLIVTPDHDMYVNHGKFTKGGRKKYPEREILTKPAFVSKGKISYSKEKAKDMLLFDNDNDGIQFLAYAENGILQDNNSYLPFIDILGLRTDSQIHAFLKFYGYWLGDGHLTFQTNYRLSNDAIVCAPVKECDVEFLQDVLNQIGFVEGLDWRYYTPGEKTIQHQFVIVNASYVEYFRSEYQLKYANHSKSIISVPNSENAPTLEEIKSAKWLWNWCKYLNRDQCRSLIRGLRYADGSESGNINAIFTSSIRFRDELMQIMLHAGYSPMFKLMYRAGESRGIDKKSGKEFIAKHDAWTVNYATQNVTKPSLRQSTDVKRVSYHGRTWCVTMPHGFIITRRARTDANGRIILASRPTIQGNCSKDAELPLRILEKMDAVVNGVEQARVTGVSFKWLLSKGQGIKTFSKLLRDKEPNEYVPTLSPRATTGETAGGHVEEPRRGWYPMGVITLDFSSLYPSIMIAYNICYSTKVSRAWAKKHLKESDYWSPFPAVDGGKETDFVFVKKHIREGILPKMLAGLLGARTHVKGLMKKVDEEAEPLYYSVLNGRQLALKVVCNSVYGFLKAFILRDKDLMSAVTSYGRNMIYTVKKVIETEFQNRKLVDVEACQQQGIDPEVEPPKEGERDLRPYRELSAFIVYGDTDSVMVCFGDLEGKKKERAVRKRQKGEQTTLWGRSVPIAYEEEKKKNMPRSAGSDDIVPKYVILKEMILLGKEMAAKCTAKFEKPNSLTFETIKLRGGWLNKKRYFALEIEKFIEGERMADAIKRGSISVKGLEGKRRDNAFINSATQNECIRILLKENNVEKIERFIISRIEALLTGKIDISELVITKGLAKTDEQYAKGGSKQQHVELKKRMAKRAAFTGEVVPDTGDRVPFIVKAASAKNVEKAFELSEHPLYAQRNGVPINTDYYINKQIWPAVSRIMTCVYEPERCPEIKSAMSEKVRTTLKVYKRFFSPACEHMRHKKQRTTGDFAMAKHAVVIPQCLGCGARMNGEGGRGACCRHCDEERVANDLVLHAVVKMKQRDDAWDICRKCQGGSFQKVTCSNLTCKNFFHREQMLIDMEDLCKKMERFH